MQQTGTAHEGSSLLATLPATRGGSADGAGDDDKRASGSAATTTLNNAARVHVAKWTLTVVVACCLFAILALAAPGGDVSGVYRRFLRFGVGDTYTEPVEFVLHTKCIPDDVKARSAPYYDWTRPITSAFIVHHNFGTQSFFDFPAAFEMAPETPGAGNDPHALGAWSTLFSHTSFKISASDELVFFYRSQ